MEKLLLVELVAVLRASQPKPNDILSDVHVSENLSKLETSADEYDLGFVVKEVVLEHLYELVAFDL